MPAEAQALERSQEEAREAEGAWLAKPRIGRRREAAEQSARETAGQAAAEEAARRRQAEEAEARTRREGLSRMNQLIGRVESLIGREDVSLKAADRALRDVRDGACRRAAAPVENRTTRTSCGVSRPRRPRSRRKCRICARSSEWQRWANVGIQEQLCEKMEALRSEGDPEAIARRIHDLQQQWRLAADVPRPQGEALWRRFKTAHDELWVRCEAHFAAQAEAAGREPDEEVRALRTRRGAGRLEQLGADRRGNQGAAGGVEGHRFRHARSGKSDLGTIPRGLRPFLHAPPGRSRQAQSDVGRELRRKRKRSA